jgi:hypothetical protein
MFDNRHFAIISLLAKEDSTLQYSHGDIDKKSHRKQVMTQCISC